MKVKWSLHHKQGSHYSIINEEGWTMLQTTDDTDSDLRIAQLTLNAVNNYEFKISDYKNQKMEAK